MSRPPGGAIAVDVGGSSIKIHLSGRRPQQFARPASLTPSVLTSLIRSCLGRRGKSARLIVGLRGVWTSNEKKPWSRALHRLAHDVEVLSDIELAHWLIFHDGAGIVLNAGTGSIAFGRNKRGISARAGGLGPLLGDEGSGFWIGREWLRHQSENGGMDFRKYIRSEQPARTIATLAPKVLARRGPVEKRILQGAQQSLVELVRSVYRQLQWEGKAPVMLVGSLFQDARFRRGVEKKLGTKFFRVAAA